MSNFLTYLEREHARLEAVIAGEGGGVRDEIEIERLERLKRAIEDQIGTCRAEVLAARASN
jgi:hypothetical protein